MPIYRSDSRYLCEQPLALRDMRRRRSVASCREACCRAMRKRQRGRQEPHEPHHLRVRPHHHLHRRPSHTGVREEREGRGIATSPIAPPTCFASGRRSFPHTRIRKKGESVHYLRLSGTRGVVRPDTYAHPDKLHAPELTRSQTRNI